MKKKVFTVLALIIIGISSASAQAVWGARVGFSRPIMTYTWAGEYGGAGDSEQLEGVFGLELGPVMYYSLAKNFYINTGAMFNIKTFKDEGSYENWGYDPYTGPTTKIVNYSDKFSAYYLDIPLNLGYSFNIGDASLYAQAGPFLGFKLAEKDTYKENGQVVTYEGEEDYLTSMNAGLGIMAGVNINKFKIELGYQIGLANVLNDKESRKYGDKIKINSLFLGVSYVF